MTIQPLFRPLFFSLLLGCCLLSIPSFSEAGMQKKKFSVPGMMCATSAMTATAAVTALPGVVSADDDTSNQTLTIVFDDEKASVEKIREALKKENLPVRGEPADVP